MGLLFRKEQLSSRWGAAALAALIGTISGWTLFVTAVRLYFEYVYYPHVKAQDGYIYPQWRYTLFDAVQVAWCLNGLLAAVLLFPQVALWGNGQRGGRPIDLLFFSGFCGFPGGRGFRISLPPPRLFITKTP